MSILVVSIAYMAVMSVANGLEADPVYQRIEPDPTQVEGTDLEFFLEVPSAGVKQLPNVLVLCRSAGISQLIAELRYGDRLLATLNLNKITFPGQCRLVKPVWKVRDPSDIPLVAADGPFQKSGTSWTVVVKQHASK